MTQPKDKRVGFSFIYHLILFIIVHVLFAWFVGVIPAADLPSGSYFEHISKHLWNQGVDIYLNDKVNMVSKVWKTVLIIHGIIDLSYLLFPSKKKEQKSTNESIPILEKKLPESTDSKPKSAPAALNKEKPPISTRTGWIFIIIGGALEIVWASSFKYSWVSPIIVLVALLTSFDLLIRAAKVIPIGTVYGVFTGIGTVGLVIMEAIQEGYIKPLKVGIILLLMVFIILLKLTGGGKEKS